jgi:hypothetical protein
MSSPEPITKVYNVKQGTLVQQKQTQLYEDSGYEGLYKVVNLVFVGYEWVKLFSTTNPGPTEKKYPVRFATSYGTDTGKPIRKNEQLGIDDILTGLELDYGRSDKKKKIFQETEIGSSGKNYRPDVTVRPNGGEIFIYQKHYKFQTQVWFLADTSGNRKTIVKKDGTLAGFKDNINVKAYELMATRGELSGTSEIPEIYGITPKWPKNDYKVVLEGTTSKAHSYLQSLGVDP